MKKVKRIVFCVILAFILFSTVYSLYNTYSLFLRNVNRDPNFLLPVLFGVFSLFSLLFNLKKLFTKVVVHKTVYFILRTTDFIFSLAIALILIVNVYQKTKNFIAQESDYGNTFFRLFMLLIMLFLCVLVFLDNLQYHKELKKEKELNSREFINLIGK